MEDAEIVRLCWERNERAIPEMQNKYGRYCTSIAMNILGSREDAEECVNDTYLKAWNAIPPHKPRVLAAFVGKIVRNLSLNRYKRDHATKRGGGEAPIVLDEVLELVSDGDSLARETDRRALVAAIEAFLGALPAEKRAVFVRRYWYFDRVSDIATRFGVTENQVSVTLSRLRAKLRDYLLERGFEL